MNCVWPQINELCNEKRYDVITLDTFYGRTVIVKISHRQFIFYTFQPSLRGADYTKPKSECKCYFIMKFSMISPMENKNPTTETDCAPTT